MNQTLISAIGGKKIININYDGGNREIEPHCYGVSKDGNELLRAFQTGGHSSSGESMGWKLFRVDQFNGLAATDKTFPGPRPLYNPNDKAMEQIIAHI